MKHFDYFRRPEIPV